ncbi:hypothetical protein MHYP_G00190700 [Metynnis hypsauchen]
MRQSCQDSNLQPPETSIVYFPSPTYTRELMRFEFPQVEKETGNVQYLEEADIGVWPMLGDVMLDDMFASTFLTALE